MEGNSIHRRSFRHLSSHESGHAIQEVRAYGKGVDLRNTVNERVMANLSQQEISDFIRASCGSTGHCVA